MIKSAPTLLAAACSLSALACGGETVPDRSATLPEEGGPVSFRVAQFNIREMSREKVDEIDAAGRGTNEQLLAAAEILRQVRPDIVLINEIDIRQEGRGPLERVWLDFQARYLNTGDAPLRYDHIYAPPVNTGVLSGFDLNNDGVVGADGDRGTRAYGDDSFGYGVYPGQYGMLIASRFPLDMASARTFRSFLWRDMPGHVMPPGWYSDEETAVFRLSSKTHLSVPVAVDGRRIHLLGAHPTPPGFDGEEDRNGRRNRDEVRFLVDLIEGADYIVDDAGVRGGLPADAAFIVLGDLNASRRGDDGGADHPIHALLDHPRVQDTGGLTVSEGGLAGREPGPPAHFERSTTGRATGLRIDYVLPSTDLQVKGGGVYFPDGEVDPVGARRADQASDHRLVWVDLAAG
jgi:endonuclease/exonuclease/phosphatase family metal-dependent hydrolase